MKQLFGRKTLIICAGLAVLLFTLSSCARQQTQTDAAATPEKAAQQPADPQPAKLAKHYTKVMCQGFSSAPEVATGYPTAANDVQQSMITALGAKKAFKEVGIAKGAKADAQTLLVKATVTEVRIVSGAARMWGGAFAGSSFVTLDMQLLDGATMKSVREEKLSTANNAWAASWSGGATDHSLLSDMGKIIAEYIASANPAK